MTETITTPTPEPSDVPLAPPATVRFDTLRAGDRFTWRGLTFMRVVSYRVEMRFTAVDEETSRLIVFEPGELVEPIE